MLGSGAAGMPLAPLCRYGLEPTGPAPESIELPPLDDAAPDPPAAALPDPVAFPLGVIPLFAATLGPEPADDDGATLPE